MKKQVAIRLDASPKIGTGHAMRCMSIAEELVKQGHQVVFLVSDDNSSLLINQKGFKTICVGGNRDIFSYDDACVLNDYASEFDVVLIDTYAVTADFFDGLIPLSSKFAWIDDLYTYDKGRCVKPVFHDVGLLINYGFFADCSEYKGLYQNAQTKLLLGPRYAPIRKEFRDIDYAINERVSNILLTSGGANPGRMLERSASACTRCLPDASIEVIVGPLAEIDEEVLKGFGCHLNYGIKRMSDYMKSADLVISAAGSTLYELCAIGVPTIAVPVVDNQLPNAQGFSKFGFGLALDSCNWSLDEISLAIKCMSSSFARREDYSRKMKQSVDALGAQRIAEALTA